MKQTKFNMKLLFLLSLLLLTYVLSAHTALNADTLSDATRAQASLRSPTDYLYKEAVGTVFTERVDEPSVDMSIAGKSFKVSALKGGGILSTLYWLTHSEAIHALYMMIPILILLTASLLRSLSLEKKADSRAKELQIKIQELTKTQKELHAAEKKLANIIESVAEGIFVYNAKGEIILANQAAWSMTSTTKDQIEELQANSRAWKVIKEDGSEFPLAENPVTRILKGEVDAISNVHLGIMTEDRGIRWFLTSAVAIRDAYNRTLDYIVCNCMEITEIKSKDKALRESEDKYAALFMNMSDGMAYQQIVYDENNMPCDYRFVEVNDSYEKLTKLKREDVIGKTATEAVPYTVMLQDAYRELFIEVALMRRSVKFEYYMPYGEKWFLISAYSPKAGYIATLLTDITEQKNYEKQIMQMNEELEARVANRTNELTAINKELEAFCYSVSHDLRAPLRSIDGFSQALLEDYGDSLDEDALNYLGRVRGASQRMGHLIDDLLSLSRITRGEMENDEVNLTDIARNIAETLKSETPGRKVDFQIQENITLMGDARFLHVVLENLLGNAWKYTSKNDTATIGFGMIEEDGKKVCFVEDDGVGFDMRYADKLFGAFQRLHGAKEFDGNGIGLAIVQRIINKHGGSVWAQGEVGKGAKFYFTVH